MNYDQNWQGQPQGGPVTNVIGELSGPDKITVTLKADGGYDAPWIVFHAASNAEAADLIGAADASGLWAIVGKASADLKAEYAAGKGLGATPVQSPAAGEQQFYQQPPPAQAQGGYQQPAQAAQQYQAPPPQTAEQPPPGPAPACPHGPKVFKPNGVSKTGKPYSATWNCSLKVANYRDPNGCPTEWINSR